jgi:hypothetical protein
MPAIWVLLAKLKSKLEECVVVLYWYKLLLFETSRSVGLTNARPTMFDTPIPDDCSVASYPRVWLTSMTVCERSSVESSVLTHPEDTGPV